MGPTTPTRHHLISLCLITAFTCLPAAALEQVTATIEPLQPQLGRNFTVVVEGMASCSGAELDGVDLDVMSVFPTLTIKLHEAYNTGPCIPGPFRSEVPINGSLPFEEQELYLLEVRDVEAAEPKDELLFASYFAMGRTFFHVLRPEVRFDPFEPTDNDSVQMLIASEPNVCGPSSPEVDRVERAGKSLRIFLEFSSGFGPAAAGVPGPAEKCTPAVPYLDAVPIELGQLEAGNYAYEVYLRERNGATLDIRTNRGNFEVTDAPDLVRLQDERFEVRAEWTDFESDSGNGRPVPAPAGVEDSTLFSFFDPDNWELMVKILDGCDLNDHYWVFSAAATTVEYTITVTDTQTGEEWTYQNPLGVQSAAVTDTSAFACSP